MQGWSCLARSLPSICPVFLQSINPQAALRETLSAAPCSEFTPSHCQPHQTALMWGFLVGAVKYSIDFLLQPFPKPSYKSITGISISKEENNPGYIYFIDSSLCLRKEVSLLLLAILCWRYRKKKILYKHSLWLLHFFGLHQEKCFCKVILPKATTITQMKRISHIFCHHLIQFSTSTDTSTSFFASTISQTDVHAEGHFLSIQGQIKSSLLL